MPARACRHPRFLGLPRGCARDDTRATPSPNAARSHQAFALRQLESGAATVQEIAFSLGYNSAAAFSRAFRRWRGMSPREWREAHERFFEQPLHDDTPVVAVGFRLVERF